MQRLKDLSVGQNVNITLVVISATARETKAKKPYLQLELFDGYDKIGGNYWDWAGKNIPAKNAILDVVGQVTEYMGVKQLNIKALTTNTERHLSEFEPSSGFDLAEVYKEAYALSSDINDFFLRSVALNALEQLQPLWLKVPGAKGVHHAFVGGTLVHSLSVAKIARDISRNIPDSNDELCFIGGLLHDIGKLYTYKMNGLSIDMTDEGMLYDHVFIGAEFIGNFIEAQTWYEEDYMYNASKLELLRHIILSHHGLLEYGAAVPPMCIEAHIVNHADGVDASTQQIIEQSRKLEGAKWTEKIYTLNNRPQLTTQYVKAVFSGEEK